MLTFCKLFFWYRHHKVKIWSHRSDFWQDFFGFSIFGHFFCPFFEIPKYFAQKYLKKYNILFKVFKDIFQQTLPLQPF